MGLSAAAFLVLAFPACAQSLLGGRTDLGFPARSRPAAVAMAGMDGLAHKTRYELFNLYQAYIAAVKKRREQHWRANLLSGEIVEHPDEPLLPARQLEEAVAKREAEVKLLEGRLQRERPAAPPSPVKKSDALDWTAPIKEEARPGPSEAELALKAKKKELKSFRRQLSRSKGLAIDWSDAVWAELMKVDAEDWRLSDETRAAGPRHTAAILCSPAEEPSVCLAFDPWKTGEPDAYEYRSWDNGSFDGRIPPEYFLQRLPDRE